MPPRFPPPCWSFLRSEIVKVEPGHAVVRFRPTEDFENPYGNVQGGLLAAMVNNCLGPAIIAAAPDRQSATAELSLHYLRPARAGEVVVAEAQVVRLGRTVAYIEVTVSREDGELLARAAATQVFTNGADKPVEDVGKSLGLP